MSIFILPYSNTLRWVRTDAQATSYPTLDSLKGEENYFGRQTFHNFIQNFNIGDIVLNQYTTDYPTVTVTLYQNDETSLGALTPILAYTFLDTSGIKMWDIYLPTTTLGGVYYIQIDASGDGMPTLQFKSDLFEIDDYSDYLYLTYTQKERSGISYALGQTFALRFDGYCFEADFEESEESYKGYNNAIEILKNDVSRVMKLRVFPASLGLITSIRLALTHQNVTLNGISVAKKDKVKITPIPETNLYELECDLQDVAFEDYTSLVDQGGQPTDVGLLIYSDAVTDYYTYSDTSTDKLTYY